MARTDTRQKMLATTVELLCERGAAGVTVDAVLARSEAPRGSVYYHFPGGRNEMLSESLVLAGDTISDLIEEATTDGWLAAVDRFGRYCSELLVNSDYSAGCPVTSVAIGGSPGDQHLQPTVAEIFQRWHHALVAAISADGMEQRADRLATTAIAALEGAVILCRAQRSTDPLDEVIAELKAAFDPDPPSI